MFFKSTFYFITEIKCSLFLNGITLVNFFNQCFMLIFWEIVSRWVPLTTCSGKQDFSWWLAWGLKLHMRKLVGDWNEIFRLPALLTVRASKLTLLGCSANQHQRNNSFASPVKWAIRVYCFNVISTKLSETKQILVNK